MSDLDSRIPYWDAAATTKTFTHPLHLPWLDGIGGHAVILDYGCGYGRVTEELQQHGFDNLTGVDTSPPGEQGGEPFAGVMATDRTVAGLDAAGPVDHSRSRPSTPGPSRCPP